ncbi:MAG: type IV toxin-antitoxin system AbiEi family antitoxin [Terriglobia bacterium]
MNLIAKVGKLRYTGKVTVSEVLQAVRANEPFKGLPNIRVENLVDQSIGDEGEFDAQFDLRFGDMNVKVYVEAKTNCTPKQIDQIAPWLARMKAVRRDAAFALLCPSLSPQSQTLCIEKGIDFIDLAGNIFINVPGRVMIQRIGLKAADKIDASFYRNPFSGKSSRILRVLLQKPESWTLREITEELKSESRRAQGSNLDFQVSTGFASRVLRSLEEQVLVVSRRKGPGWIESQALRKLGKQPRRDSEVFVPEPKRLLDTWAEKYKERSRWNLRKSFILPNPFGANLNSVRQDLDKWLDPQGYAFTGAAAANILAPFVDVDVIDVYIFDEAAARNLRARVAGPSVGPEIRVIKPYDAGVFLYSRRVIEIPIVTEIQMYLDLFARGGRDLKQADYLFEKRIAPSWVKK